MALRGKTPELKPNRLRALIYGNKGVGKTHFTCSIPDVYYIDTEGAGHYKKFVDMLKVNGGSIVEINDLEEIIKEVKDLISTKHTYKTLVIDSISVPCAHLAVLEAERLVKKAPHTEGTEFGANLAKVKRLTFHIGILLSRLDMNVIVTAHEKPKYFKNEEVGKDADVNEKMSYCLGSVFQLRLQGQSRKLFVEKTRYSEMKTGDLIDFDDGYGEIKKRFGEEVFLRDSVPEILASKEQILKLRNIMEEFNYPDEKKQKWLSTYKINSFDEMPSATIDKCIKFFESKVKES